MSKIKINTMEVSKETLEKTTNCKKSFDCLYNDKHIFCKAENCVSNEVLFVKCLYEDACEYRIPFGQSFVCNCPIRKEIFNKYGI